MLQFKKYNMLTRFFSILCCIAMLLSSFGISALADEAETDNVANTEAETQTELPQNVPIGECVAENDVAAFYADVTTGNFCLQNKANGQIWYNKPIDVENDTYTVGSAYTNVQSSIVIGYVDRSSEPSANELSYANDYVYCPPEQMEITNIKNGVKIVYNMNDFGFSVPVEYTLNGSYLEAKIDVKNIKEGDKNFIVNINLLPVFGAGNWETEGKLLVPDGSGAVINFNNGTTATSPYVSKVYGEDLVVEQKTLKNKLQPTLMPVFATIKNEGSLFGIITEGDADASVTYLNGNARCGYNAISSIFNYRVKNDTVMFSGTGSSNTINRVSRIHSEAEAFRIRYYVTNKSDYPALAEIYRNYLIKEKAMKQTVNKASLNLDIYGMVETKSSFLGIPYNKKLALTDYSEAQQIIGDLKESGIKNLTVRYIGWNNNGITNKKINSSAKASGLLGGKKGLRNLISYSDKENVNLYLDNDIIRFRKNGNGVKTSRNAIKNVFNEETVLHTYMRSVYATVLSEEDIYIAQASKVTDVFNKYLKSVKKQYGNLKNIGLSTTGNMMYSNPQAKKGELCTALMNNYVANYKKAVKKGYNLVFEKANAYTFPYAERLLSVPETSSNYDTFDADVPFYSMVLHGTKNMSICPLLQSDNPQKNFLKAVEMGIALNYSGIYEDSSLITNTLHDYLYSSNYKLWQETAVEQYKQYNDLYEKIYNLPVTEYVNISQGVTKTVFGGKIAVYVNYSKKAVETDGVTIEAESFTVKEMQ